MCMSSSCGLLMKGIITWTNSASDSNPCYGSTQHKRKRKRRKKISSQLPQKQGVPCSTNSSIIGNKTIIISTLLYYNENMVMESIFSFCGDNPLSHRLNKENISGLCFLASAVHSKSGLTSVSHLSLVVHLKQF